MTKPILLVVDDEIEVHEHIRKIVKDLDIDHQEAFDVSSAKALFDAVAPTVILLDNCLGLLRGHHFLEHVRTVDQNTPVLLHTNHVGREDFDKYLSLGIDSYLNKDIPRDTLKEVLKQKLGVQNG